jgi:hypothetical protein
MTSGSHTIHVAAPGWRSGFDNQQHAAVDPRKAACGEPVREQRYDRPDWPRCLDCVEIEGITVPAPSLPWSESELRLGDGNR